MHDQYTTIAGPRFFGIGLVNLKSLLEECSNVCGRWTSGERTRLSSERDAAHLPTGRSRFLPLSDDRLNLKTTVGVVSSHRRERESAGIFSDAKKAQPNQLMRSRSHPQFESNLNSQTPQQLCEDYIA